MMMTFVYDDISARYKKDIIRDVKYGLVRNDYCVDTVRDGFT